ncbi:MAG: DUF1015 domain-containing protein [Treponema sp.]|nr:DUF1015 domain-containing protein [Treponema sp.]MCL2271537.1 DUF1015 domain-containing protein [Treponema sp.]
MNDRQKKLNSLGVDIPDVLLPQNTDMQKWAVIACDQFTQDPGFWEKIKTTAGGSPSALNLIFPEVYLPDPQPQERIKDIHLTMKRYLDEGVFKETGKGFIYIERNTPWSKTRRGLVAAVDLERYDWHSDSRPLIRCTEGTVPERLPARMDIRRGAPLELPHVLLLIDDDTDSLLPPLGDIVIKEEPLYSTPLMMNSGHVTGWFLNKQEALSLLTEELDKLCLRSLTRYEGGKPFLFAVGDGNHSLAAAKEIWEEYKKNHGFHGTDNPPCRYALVEIENIYDPAVTFEPIHRLVFDIGFEGIKSLLSQLPDFSCTNADSVQELSKEICIKSERTRMGVICEGRYALVETSASGISTAALQPLLDSAVKNGKPLSVDYIHDEKELLRLTNNHDAGILLPPVEKSGLFETVGRFGPLPRKSFSMGHSLEKRFYMESRRILV